MTHDDDIDLAESVRLDGLFAAPLDRREFFRLSGQGVLASSVALGGLGSLVASGEGIAGAAESDASIRGSTINFLGLDGEDGKPEGAAWRKANGVTLKSTYISSGDELFAKLKVGQQYDLLSIPNPNVKILIDAHLVKPLDLRRLPNYAQMYPVLRYAKWNRDSQGRVYSAPLAWGDGPYVYDTRKLKASDIPKSIMAMADKKWYHKIVTIDDPYGMIDSVAAGLGYRMTYLTKAQLANTVAYARKIMKNMVAVAKGYADETDYLVRGEAEIGLGGWEAQLNMAAQKGVKLGYGFFKESNWMWCDSYGIPITVKSEDAAYAYINAMLGAKINAKLATDLISGTVNRYAYGHIPAKVRKLYQYKAVTDFNYPRKVLNWLPPENPPPGIASLKDYQQAWESLKA